MFRMGWETIEEALERHQVRFATQSVLVRSEVDLATLDIGERLFVFVHENPHAQYFSEANGYRCLALDEPDACFRIFTVYRASEGSKGVLLERFAACIKETCAPA